MERKVFFFFFFIIGPGNLTQSLWESLHTYQNLKSLTNPAVKTPVEILLSFTHSVIDLC